MARLPKPGGDSGDWGEILNNYLRKSHNEDGTLKKDSISAVQLSAGSVTSAAIGAAGNDGDALVRDSSKTSGLAWQQVSGGGGSTTVPDATTSQKGVVQLAGDLGGTAEAPTVPGLSNKADSADVYTRSQVDSALGGKYDSPTGGIPASDLASAVQSSLSSADTAVQPSALSAYVPNSEKAQANGVATLNSSGKIPQDQLPDVSAPIEQVNADWDATSGVEQILNKPTLSAVATSGDYADLSGTPGLAAVATSGNYIDLSGAPVLASVATSGNYNDLIGAPGLATVATSGSYDDLIDKPTVPTSLDSLSDVSTGGASSGQVLKFNGTSWAPGNDNSSGGGGATVQPDGSRFLDSFAGGTDDEKLTAAISWQQATAGMPPIRLGARVYNFNQTRQLYSGLKLIGVEAGPQNLELNGGGYVSSNVQLGSGIGSGTSSWWVTPGGNLYDIYMACFATDGDHGSSQQQFIDATTGTIYASQFHALSFNFMRSVFGRKDRKFLMTQVVFSGHWTVNNLWDTQFHLGGADNNLWMQGYMNIGVSSSPAQTGSLANNDYQIIMDSLSKTNVGYIFMSALNGWRGLLVSGSAGHGLRFYGGSYEGYKGSNDNLAAPGTVIRVEGGTGAFYSPSVGQAMQNPESSERAPIHVTGGEWSFYSPSFYKGPMSESTPCLYHGGGRVMVTGVGANSSGGESWSGRPRYESVSASPNSTNTSFYCPDFSMVSV